ncbi:MAG: hypothetical protein U9N77_12395, partial [Thermodesulfobacteriota bacterium]|nr:hypothetical protein [Thermodesulfobacteriota bacterium]
MLQGPHILELVTRKIVKPAGLVVYQKRELLNRRAGKDISIYKAVFHDAAYSSDEDLSITEEFSVKVDEKLWFSYPGRFRCETVSGTSEGITVFANHRFVKIVQEEIVAEKESFADHYTDILLFRDRENLGLRLKTVGVDLNCSSLKRYKQKICYVVGNIKDKEN